jgi:hypothetical protein
VTYFNQLSERNAWVLSSILSDIVHPYGTMDLDAISSSIAGRLEEQYHMDTEYK